MSGDNQEELRIHFNGNESADEHRLGTIKN